MKVKLKNILGLAALGMTLLANTVPTWAGSVSTQGVSIQHNFPNPNESYVGGTMVGARYSADGRQYIGCSLDATPRVQCAAQDSADNFAYCYSNNPKHVDEIQRMTDSSYIVFKVDRATVACKSIYISNSSTNLQ